MKQISNIHLKFHLMTAPKLEAGLLMSDSETILLKETPVSGLSPIAIEFLLKLSDLSDFLLFMMSDNLFMARIASTHRAHFLLAWNCFSFTFN